MPNGGNTRPVLGLDVDGVLALGEPPSAEGAWHEVSASGRWRRRIYVPSSAPAKIRDFSTRYQIVWVSAWGHTAHTALRQVLDLPEAPWMFLPVQFCKLPALASWAAERPWALIHDGVDDDGALEYERHVVRVDPRRGIDQVDAEDLERVFKPLELIVERHTPSSSPASYIAHRSEGNLRR